MKKDTEKERLSPQASTHVSRRSLLFASLGGVTAMGALGAPKPVLASDLGTAHTGSKSHTVRGKLGEIVSVKRFGAKGDGITDDTKAFRKALIKCNVVYVPPGTYIISSTLTLRSTQRIVGAGSTLTGIRLADGANCDMLKTEDFDSLTGTNSWFVDTEGVPHGFGIEGIRFDGNRASNSAGDGLKIYGKRYILRDIFIVDMRGVGIYSECADKGGQHDWRDAPEALLEDVKTRWTGSFGLQFRGPHDSRISSLFVSRGGWDDGADGVIFESKKGVYNGTAAVNFIHSWSNHGAGVRFNTMTRSELIIGESSWKEGIVVDSSFGTFGCLYAFKNDMQGTGTYYNIRIAGARNQVGRLHIKDRRNSAGGLLVTGAYNTIDNAFIKCFGTESLVGASLETNGTVFRGEIQEYKGAGACGLKTNAKAYSMQDIRAKIYGCRTSWDNGWSGELNRYSVNAYNSNPSFKLFSGNQFNANEEVEFWGANRYETILSKQKGSAELRAGDTFVDVPHDLMLAPELSDIVVSPTSDLGGLSYWVSDITATTFRINISDTLGSDSTFTWRAEL